MKEEAWHRLWVFMLAAILVVFIWAMETGCQTTTAALRTVEIGASTSDWSGFATQRPARGAQGGAETLWVSIRPLAGLELEAPARPQAAPAVEAIVETPQEAPSAPEGDGGEGEGLRWGPISIGSGVLVALLGTLGLWLRSRRRSVAGDAS